MASSSLIQIQLPTDEEGRVVNTATTLALGQATNGSTPLCSSLVEAGAEAGAGATEENVNNDKSRGGSSSFSNDSNTNDSIQNKWQNEIADMSFFSQQKQQQADDKREEEEEEEEEVMSALELAEMVSRTEYGALMKQRIGVAGATPAQDSFPYSFKDTKIWVILVWDVDPTDWKLVFFDKEPVSVESKTLTKSKSQAMNNSNDDGNDDNNHKRDEEEGGGAGGPKSDVQKIDYEQEEEQEEVVDLSLAIGDLLISEIEEIELDPSPSTSFRVYRNVMDNKGKEYQEVTKLTPLPDISGHACVWTDAIYAAMQLQTFPVEETVDIRERYFERKALLQEEGGGEEEENREEGANCRDVEEGGGFDKQRASMNVDYHKIYSGAGPEMDGISEPSSVKTCSSGDGESGAKNECCTVS